MAAIVRPDRGLAKDMTQFAGALRVPVSSHNQTLNGRLN
jgi:hypothetical protein